MLGNSSTALATLTTTESASLHQCVIEVYKDEIRNDLHARGLTPELLVA